VTKVTNVSNSTNLWIRVLVVIFGGGEERWSLCILGSSYRLQVESPKHVHVWQIAIF